MKHYEKINLPHAVYRIFNAEGVLLYVGASMSVFGRLSNHGVTKSWIREASSVTLEWFDGYFAAVRAEARAILSEHPKYNKAKPDPESVGMHALKKAGRKPRGDGTLCPRCGNPKEDVRPGKSYCRPCNAEYQKTRRLKILAAQDLNVT